MPHTTTAVEAAARAAARARIADAVAAPVARHAAGAASARGASAASAARAGAKALQDGKTSAASARGDAQNSAASAARQASIAAHLADLIARNSGLGTLPGTVQGMKDLRDEVSDFETDRKRKIVMDEFAKLYRRELAGQDLPVQNEFNAVMAPLFEGHLWLKFQNFGILAGTIPQTDTLMGSRKYETDAIKDVLADVTGLGGVD